MLMEKEVGEKEIRELCSWHYPGKYAVYDLPSYEQCKIEKMAFTDPHRRTQYHAYYEGEVMVAFTNITKKEEGVFIGIGVHPNHCNEGYGQNVLHLVDVYCAKHYPTLPLYLDVRVFNHRAIACYEKAGYVIQGRVFYMDTPKGKAAFYRMVKER